MIDQPGGGAAAEGGVTRRASGPTYGAQIRDLRTVEYSLLETRHEEGLRLPMHAHCNPTITLLLDGSFSEHMEGRTHTCRPWDVVYKPGGLEHANEYGDAGARCFVVEMTGHGLTALGDTPDDVCDRPWVGRGAISVRMHALYSGLFGAEERTLRTQELLAVLMEPGAWSTPSPRAAAEADPAWLGRIRDLLRAHLRRPPPLPDLAAEAGVHPSHLCRAFRRRFGCTIGTYVRRARVDAAVRRLTAGPVSDLSRLALELGYYDQSHFTHAFRRVTGVTPGTFRDACSADSTAGGR